MSDEEIKKILIYELGFEGELLNHLVMESLETAGFKERVEKNTDGKFEASYLGKNGVGDYPLAAMKNLWLAIYNDPDLKDKLKKERSNE